MYNADEVVQTGTSYPYLSVSRINRPRPFGSVHGPIAARLLEAYNEEFGLNIAEQYLSHLEPEERQELELKADSLVA